MDPQEALEAAPNGEQLEVDEAGEQEEEYTDPFTAIIELTDRLEKVQAQQDRLSALWEEEEGEYLREETFEVAASALAKVEKEINGELKELQGADLDEQQSLFEQSSPRRRKLFGVRPLW